MKNWNIIILLMAFAISSFSFSCNKEQKQEQPQNNVQQEQYVDKEKQLKEKEELLRIKEESLNAREQAIFKKEQELGIRPDTTSTGAIDSTKIKEKEKKEKKIEKELNKRLDNPTETVSTYIEYLQRAITDPGKYDDNIKRANELWQSDRLKLLQSSYKNTEKITILNEPTAITNKDNKATVRVKIKKTDKDNKETNMVVTYNLVADKNGKWKIKNNVIEK
jgi:hypothetical protein